MPPFRLLLIPASVLLASANPPADADALVREGAAAFARGDLDAADRLLAAADAATDDPGLVAFDRAAVLFARGRFRDAEVHYLRALADDAIPPGRRARALFDRGVSLLKQGDDAGTLRAAVGCFAACRDSPDVDPTLAADARHNLELAKLRWDAARRKSSKPPTPNDPAAAPPEPRTRPAGTDPAADPANPGGAADPKRATPVAGPVPDSTTPRATDRLAPGAGRVPVLEDSETPQPLSPDDTRALLGRAAGRLDRARRATAQTLAPPARPGVRDW